ncbi:MAG: response regulator [Ignavibacteriae bacterium]|nr:response regulator [Ignavibacteriota bacterium]
MEPFVENRKVLYVDDEPQLLASFTSLMRKERCFVTTLQDATGIRTVIDELGPFALVLSDQRMPTLEGVDVLDIVRQLCPDTVRVLITGYADQSETIRAINIGGIHSYVAKPWDDMRLRNHVQEWIDQHNMKTKNQWLTKSLDEENKKLTEILDGTVAQSVRVLGDIVSHVSPAVATIGARVKALGEAFLRMSPEISKEEQWQIQRALELFHLGAALIPASIQASIAREGLDALERYPVARNHHLLAASVIKDIPRFEEVARIIELQAKDLDGSGEPVHVEVTTDDIPRGARLLHILIDIVAHRHSTSHVTDLLHEMMRAPQKYDPVILQKMLGAKRFDEPLGDERLVRVTGIVPGMVLKEDILTLSGQLLLKAGSVLTETSITTLWQWHKNEPIQEPLRVCGLEN